eukprot:TRINITY_DN60520_c0_g1_i1.p1 TRINITY_DN60520_c0_g1~~TRINITY_DN60520_c0_g1_i1.p1  ORF type:complete len:859 (+),score=132.65 TRINITY_DN60520_c0_g1_i1:31-2577(+)
MSQADVAAGASCSRQLTLSPAAGKPNAPPLLPPQVLRCEGQTPSPGSRPSAADETLLRSLAEEPFETVFEDPPRDVSQLHDEEMQILNLDTGEARAWSPTSLTVSFAGVPVDPQKLAKTVATPWRNWWSEKHRKDERLLHAAAAGDLASLAALLQEPMHGDPPVGVNARLTRSDELSGRSALHLAAGSGNPDAVEALLAAGAEVNICTMGAELKAQTPLHVAASRGHLNIIDALLDARADAGALTLDRNLPLHLAASCGHGDAITLLLARGGLGQLAIRNEFGQSPCEAALDIHTALVFQKLKNQESPSLCRLSVSSRSTSPSRSSNATSCSSESATSREAEAPFEDGYAGRTPLPEAGVLLRNARADAVHRLLHKAQQRSNDHAVEASISKSRKNFSRGPFSMLCRSPKAASPKAATPGSPTPSHTRLGSSDQGQGQSTPKVRAPFARVRHGGSRAEKVGPNSFELVNLLGRGSFGEVFQVKHKRTEKVYAMKVLQKSRILSSNLLRYAVTERNILAYVRHPYIVSLHYAFQTPSHLVLVLKYCPGGNLQHLITRERRLHEPLARLYTAEILLALIHLHERNTVFRDLKPDNVVIDEANHSMLTDFGLSKEGVGLRGTKSFCGSVAFLAPEILSRRGHGHTVDIYNLGVLLFDMLTGLPPFYNHDRETLFANIRHARLEIPQYVSGSARALIEATMEREPSRRLGATRTTDVQEHSFFSEINFAALMRREVSVPQFSSNREQNSPPWRSRRDSRAPESPFARADRAAGWRGRYARSPQNRMAENDAGVSGWEFSFVPPRTSDASAASASAPSATVTSETSSGSSRRTGVFQRRTASPGSPGSPGSHE